MIAPNAKSVLAKTDGPGDGNLLYQQRPYLVTRFQGSLTCWDGATSLRGQIASLQKSPSTINFP